LRRSIVRAAIVAALAGLAATAQAAPRQGVSDCLAGAPNAARATPSAGAAAPAWMTDALLAAFSHASAELSQAAVPAAGPTPVAAEQFRSSKPHQNPAFPAAFVFQSNSALYLAADVDRATARHGPLGG
jgi:hypothetical protein